MGEESPDQARQAVQCRGSDGSSRHGQDGVRLDGQGRSGWAWPPRDLMAEHSLAASRHGSSEPKASRYMGVVLERLGEYGSAVVRSGSTGMVRHGQAPKAKEGTAEAAAEWLGWFWCARDRRATVR
jgi:hypothetical protein